MRSMPSKPWKKIRVRRLSEDKYLLTFDTPIYDQSKFAEIIEDDLTGCLGREDALSEPNWDARSIVLTTADFDLFKKKLIYSSVQIERDD